METPVLNPLECLKGWERWPSRISGYISDKDATGTQDEIALVMALQ